MSDPSWPPPNLVMLNNALAQSGWPGERLTANSWRSLLRDRLEKVDWPSAQADLRPFVEPTFDLALLNPAIFERLLGS